MIGDTLDLPLSVLSPVLPGGTTDLIKVGLDGDDSGSINQFISGIKEGDEDSCYNTW